MHLKPLCSTLATRTSQSVALSRRYISFKALSKWYGTILYPKFDKPPYQHVCQVGDPILRQTCKKVDESLIGSPEIQKIIAQLWKVHDKFECVGLAAPQVGVPLQIFVMKLLPITIEKFEYLQSPLITPIEPKVVINPTIKVLDYKNTISAPECCVSVRSFSARVQRYTHIQIHALNEKGEKKSWEAKGYEARVIQHEIDHLSGTIFVDRMEPKTLECTAWQYVNLHQGRIEIPYGPRKKSLWDRFKEL